MALSPAYQNISVARAFKLDTENTAVDGTGETAVLHTSPEQSRGSVIEQIVIQRVTGTTAGNVNIMLRDDPSSDARLIDTIALPDTARGQTVRLYDSNLFSLVLEPGQSVLAAVTVSNEITVYVTGGIY